jgi:hypothetical protein
MKRTLALLSLGRVEERRVTAQAFRFPSPLIKPDVPISGIRLSDRLHLAAVGGAPR